MLGSPGEPQDEGRPGSKRSLSLLLVDDDPASCEAVRELLSELGYDVQQAFDDQEALRMLDERKRDILITDIRLAGRSGIELARAARHRDPSLQVILASGSEPPREHELGFPYLFLRKPFSVDQLHNMIETPGRTDRDECRQEPEDEGQR